MKNAGRGENLPAPRELQARGGDLAYEFVVVDDQHSTLHAHESEKTVPKIQTGFVFLGP